MILTGSKEGGGGQREREGVKGAQRRRGRGEPDFWGLFGRPGMMERIGFGNLIYSFDAKEKNTYNYNSKKKMKNKREKNTKKTILL